MPWWGKGRYSGGRSGPALAPGGRSALTECGEHSDRVRTSVGLSANGALTQSELRSDRVRTVF